MRAIVIERPGGPEVLKLREVPDPSPSRGEVRVRVRATSVNRADLLQRRGKYSASPGVPADIPGIELAGEVDGLGDGVTAFAVGDRVFGLVAGGSYAERVVTHAEALARIPAGMSFSDASAVPEVFLTAWDAMVTQAGLTAGEIVLVHAVGSGVGTAAVQVVRAVGARAVGTARSKDKLERARALGLEDCDGVVAHGARFADRVRSITGGRGADVVLELVGGDYLAEDLACVAVRGRIAVVGLLGGAKAQIDLASLLSKRVRVFGTVMRSRPIEEKIGLARVLARHIAPLIERGLLRPVVDRRLPLERAAEAHSALESGDVFGKVVLDV